ncbi:hypothetical protein FLP41_04190 [Paracoccus marcusii]|uniref:hypothetical protein n=1 Tax=Paracoccus marcusii TaxID=59779 RepID=UPI002ED414A0|nr:hypothetical protein FLP41_04190 [Paracoccus marcusii]
MNDYLQTRFPNILAAGDVAGPSSSRIPHRIRPGSHRSMPSSGSSAASRPITA